MCDDEVVDCGGGVDDLETTVHEAEGADCWVRSFGLCDVWCFMLAGECAVFWDPGDRDKLAITSSA